MLIHRETCPAGHSVKFASSLYTVCQVSDCDFTSGKSQCILILEGLGRANACYSINCLICPTVSRAVDARITSPEGQSSKQPCVAQMTAIQSRPD